MSESSPSLQDYAEKEQLREALRRAQAQLARANERNEELVEVTIQAATDAIVAMGPMPPITAPAKDQRHAKITALWHLTDWQGGKRTTSYNSDVMASRVMDFVKKAKSITEKERAAHAVKNCFILFGGDMMEGLFNFPTQPFEIDSTLFEQMFNVSQLEQRVVREALSVYEHVTVIPEWGNHGRIGSKRDSVPRHDNMDRMTYELARRVLLSENPRLTWEDCPEDIQRVEIGNYRALSIHCDEIGRNGYASPMTIANHITRWRSGSYPWEFRDVYGGHYHTHYELPLANGQGRFFGTGSTESDNRYAREFMAAAAQPSQRLHFIDEERGRVAAQYQIYLGED